MLRLLGLKALSCKAFWAISMLRAKDPRHTYPLKNCPPILGHFQVGSYRYRSLIIIEGLYIV